MDLLGGPGQLFIGRDPGGTPVLLPKDATQKMAVVGISDSGKSYAAGVLAEEWILRGVPLAIVDPVGIWWGLRVGVDSHPGLAVLVLGGARGEAPLPEPWDAAWLFAVDGLTFVADLSAHTLEYAHWWSANFFMKLMELGPRLTSCRRVMVEEAPVLAPQSGTTSRWSSRSKNALAHFTRVGGNHGYGLDVITQRAQAVDKNILTQCGNLLLMRMAAELDKNAISGWVAENSANINVKQALKELGSLPQGTGWLWAESWRGTNTKVAIRKRRTFHPNRRDPLGNKSVVMQPLLAREVGFWEWLRSRIQRPAKGGGDVL